MKKIFTLLLLTSTMIFALDPLSSLPSAEKKLLNKLIEKLNIPQNITNETKGKIYERMETYLEKDWSTHWMTNTSVNSSKLKDSKTQVLDLMIYNNERITNITFIYFSTEKQLFTTTKQYIEIESTKAMENYKKLEKNDKYTKESESDNYAYFNEKGYISYTGFHIENPVGLIVYESSNILDIK
ncbi:MAG: hypothetical protein U9O24_07830 [Campylobacterota bacterium]|nr:hypothetical protein [Campylobacterota bacterium]